MTTDTEPTPEGTVTDLLFRLKLASEACTRQGSDPVANLLSAVADLVGAYPQLIDQHPDGEACDDLACRVVTAADRVAAQVLAAHELSDETVAQVKAAMADDTVAAEAAEADDVEEVPV